MYPDPSPAISHHTLSVIQRLLHSLSRMPFIDTAELAGVLGEPHVTVHRALTGLLADRIVGRVSHGTAHLPSSQRYYLTAKGIGEAAETFGFATRSDFVRAYPVSRDWLALLIRRMDAVASVYRLASSLSPGIDGLRSHVESRDALESRGLRLWCHPSWVFGSSYHSLSCLAFHKCYSAWVAPRPWIWQWKEYAKAVAVLY